MERLTVRTIDGLGISRVCLITPTNKEFCGECTHKNDCGDCSLQKAVSQLATLEDILFSEDGKEVITFDRLKELVEADGEGRVVIFPCEVGDTVYAIKDKRILVLKVESWHRWVSGHLKFSARRELPRPMNFTTYEFLVDEVGKTVFLTGEAAEKALGVEKDGETICSP